MSDKIKKEIFNGVGENVRALAQLFPSAVKDGEVDFAALKQELGEFVEVGAEKYDFTWAGKAKAKAESVSDVLGRTLKYVKGDGVDENATQNLYIEGDNLEALKLLRNSYYGKIKMIYIDPPYNTGNDFVYKDNFAMTEEEKQAMAEAGEEIDEYGERLVKNNGDNSKYHTNWLNMMYPRLKIARDLLTDDGVIFISMADNELSNLLKICEEIFRKNNIEIFVWKKKGGAGNTEKILGVLTEYVVCCFKDKKPFDLNYKIFSRKYKFNDEFGDYNLEGIEKTNLGAYERKTMQFEIVDPVTNVKFLPSENMRWTLGAETVKKMIEDKKIHFDYKLNKVKCIKRKEDYDMSENVYYNLLDDEGSLAVAKDECGELLGNRECFETPKPTRLINKLIKIASNKNSLILDFFSGSATTAHAVMQLNAEDGGNRKFICVQLPEPCAEDSEAFKAGYKNICEIGKERIRRAGKKIADTAQCAIKDTKQEDVSNDVNREAIPLDIGFKVFKVADTNIRMFSNELNNVDLLRQLDIRDVDQERMDFNNGATDLDVCYELLLRHRGIPLSSKIVNAQCAIEDKNNRTYIIADSIVVCLEQTITQSLVEQLAAIDPLPNKYIFRDSSFGDDISLKENTMIYLQAIIEKNSGATKKTYTVEFI